jgi:iduronate 2-sulfatase
MCLAVGVVVCQEDQQKVKPTNLLMIMFDDLRPELSIYGRDHMITPNFERLAKRSVVFDYSFCQVAVCNPSRDSLMTGLRPDSVGTYSKLYLFLHSLS